MAHAVCFHYVTSKGKEPNAYICLSDCFPMQAKAVSDHYPIELSLRVDVSLNQVTIPVDDDNDEAARSGALGSGCCGLVGLCQGIMALFRK